MAEWRRVILEKAILFPVDCKVHYVRFMDLEGILRSEGRTCGSISQPGEST